MSLNSKKIRIHDNILLEYIYDDQNIKTENYSILTNLRENSKSYLSSNNLNTMNNSLFLVDPIKNKFSEVNTNDFNFLKIQNYFTEPKRYDKIKIYFSSGYDLDDYIGFYLNVYTNGYDKNNKYSLSNYFYLKSNKDNIKIFDLNDPFYYDEKYWVRSLSIEYPSPNDISNDRIITKNTNEPTPNSINKNLTYGEGITNTGVIFVDFSFIISKEVVFNIPYYYLNDIFNTSIPQTPEFTEIGIKIEESTQGDFFEIYATYMGSNENMDELAYNELLRGFKIQLEYVIKLYEENILTSTEVRLVTNNFTKKILYRPIIQFSNTTALISVELRVSNLIQSSIDGGSTYRINSYISKYGSLAIIDNINKYGLRMMRLSVDDKTLNTNIFNVTVNKTQSVGSYSNNTVDIIETSYPVLIDKYNIYVKNSSNNSDYVQNGLLQIMLSPFDNTFQFIIAKNIDNDQIEPYNLTEIINNGKLKMVFLSDNEKLEFLPRTDVNNNYSMGNVTYTIKSNNYNILRRIYNKGFDKFYLVSSSNYGDYNLYSGSFIFYEDVEFINETDTGSTETSTATATTTSVMSEPLGVLTDDNTTNYLPYTAPVNNEDIYNAILYVRFQENINFVKSYCSVNNLDVKIQYGSMFYINRLSVTQINSLKLLKQIEQIYVINVAEGTDPTIFVEPEQPKQETTEKVWSIYYDGYIPKDESIQIFTDNKKTKTDNRKLDDGTYFKHVDGIYYDNSVSFDDIISRLGTSTNNNTTTQITVMGGGTQTGTPRTSENYNDTSKFTWTRNTNFKFTDDGTVLTTGRSVEILYRKNETIPFKTNDGKYVTKPYTAPTTTTSGTGGTGGSSGSSGGNNPSGPLKNLL